MRVYRGSMVVGGTTVIDGAFVPLSDVHELIHSVDSIRKVHHKLLQEITAARLVVEKLAGRKESKLSPRVGREDK